MNDAKSANRPRLWRPQFSLRLLLLAFTAFAIGFPIWYRWPYEEYDSAPPAGIEHITTWQRQWGGGRLKHGVERWLQAGELIESTTYRYGVRHGLYQNGGYGGRYENGLKEGEWSGPNLISHWHKGKLDGLMVITLSPPRLRTRPGQPQQSLPVPQEPRKFELVFSEGRLTHLDGKSMTRANGELPAWRLFELQGTGVMSERLERQLNTPTDIDFVETPLKDCSQYLSDLHNLPVILDPKLAPKYDLPLTAQLHNIDFCTALLVLTAPHGMATDYRYGCIWITTAEDCEDWHDPTGVAEIKPPKGGALERAWKEISPPVDTLRTPLTDVLAYIKQPLAIEIDTSQLEDATADLSPPLVTISLRGLRFCDTLGQLLYKTGCRCRLEGDKLVILPPVEKRERETATNAAGSGTPSALPMRVVPVPAPGPPSDPIAPDPIAPNP